MTDCQKKVRKNVNKNMTFSYLMLEEVMDIIFPHHHDSIHPVNRPILTKILDQVYFSSEKSKKLWKDYNLEDIHKRVEDEACCFLWKKETSFTISIGRKFNRIDVRKYLSDYMGYYWFKPRSKIGQYCGRAYCIRPCHLYEKGCSFLSRGGKNSKNNRPVEKEEITLEIPEEEFDFFKELDPENSTPEDRKKFIELFQKRILHRETPNLDVQDHDNG